MNMTLKRTNRTELIEHLEGMCRTIPHKTTKMVVVRRKGQRHAIVKVVLTTQGVFLVPFEEHSPYVKMAPMMGSGIHEHTIDEVVDALRRCTDERVWLQWPSDVPETVVGKVMGLGRNDLLEAILWPVPHDINNVNEEVRLRCAKFGCKSAELGLLCGDCEGCGTCDILKQVDSEITIEKEKGKC